MAVKQCQCGLIRISDPKNAEILCPDCQTNPVFLVMSDGGAGPEGVNPAPKGHPVKLSLSVDWEGPDGHRRYIYMMGDSVKIDGSLYPRQLHAVANVERSLRALIKELK